MHTTEPARTGTSMRKPAARITSVHARVAAACSGRDGPAGWPEAVHHLPALVYLGQRLPGLAGQGLPPGQRISRPGRRLAGDAGEQVVGTGSGPRNVHTLAQLPGGRVIVIEPVRGQGPLLRRTVTGDNVPVAEEQSAGFAGFPVGELSKDGEFRACGLIRAGVRSRDWSSGLRARSWTGQRVCDISGSGWLRPS